MTNSILPAEERSAPTVSRKGGGWRDAWAIVLLVVMVVLVWLPRLRGPIDLRWDAAVYYTTGTALGEGKGYRLPSEPGEVRAVQYPPVLPAVVAAVQWAVGSTDYHVVGWWLRVLYAAIYGGYVLAVYALMRRFFDPLVAFLATVMAGLSFNTLFMSDLLFAEIPFALCVVGVVLLNRQEGGAGRLAGQTALAWIGFGLRSAGVALLAAWVGDALCRRKWKLAAGRAALAAMPVLAWQGYVAVVTHGTEYNQPAYAYQRAAYMYYNVPYAQNMKLIDPFAPEKGRTTAGVLAKRIVADVPALVWQSGSSLMSSAHSWRQLGGEVMTKIGLKPRMRTIQALAWAVAYALGLCAVLGMILLLMRGEWLIGLTIIFTAGLMATTPWPEQFGRYFTPIIPLLGIAMLVGVQWLGQCVTTLRKKRTDEAGRLFNGNRTPGGILFGAVVGGLALAHLAVAGSLYRSYLSSTQPGSADSPAVFFGDRKWKMYELAVDWLSKNAPRETIVASDAPQWVYIKTGLKGVMVPMVADAAEAGQMMAAVPVTYAIDDEVDIGQMASRYLKPAIEQNAGDWRTVFTTPDGKTRVLERVAATP
jgi:hypothetical protein